MTKMGSPRRSMLMTACVFLLSLSLAPGVGWSADKLGVLYSALSDLEKNGFFDKLWGNKS